MLVLHHPTKTLRVVPTVSLSCVTCTCAASRVPHWDPHWPRAWDASRGVRLLLLLDVAVACGAAARPGTLDRPCYYCCCCCLGSARRYATREGHDNSSKVSSGTRRDRNVHYTRLRNFGRIFASRNRESTSRARIGVSTDEIESLNCWNQSQKRRPRNIDTLRFRLPGDKD